MLLVFESTTVAGRLDQKLVNSQVHGKTTWEKYTVTWITAVVKKVVVVLYFFLHLEA